MVTIETFMECNLVVVHGDVELVVQLESHAPDDPPEPQAVVGVHRLGLGGDVQDVLTLVERTYVLTCGWTDGQKGKTLLNCHTCPSYARLLPGMVCAFTLAEVSCLVELA